MNDADGVGKTYADGVGETYDDGNFNYHWKNFEVISILQ